MLIDLLGDLVLVLVAAVGVQLLSHRLRVPAVVGLLLTGVLIGPAGLGWVTQRPAIEAMAEVGVVFLLFSIGLDLSLAELAQVRRAFFLGGSLYVALVLAATAGLAAAFGRRPGEATFLGLLVVLSSTAVALRLLADGRELGTPHGRLVVGISLFQDFLLVPMLLLVPILAGEGEAPWLAIVGRLALGVAVMTAVFFVARRVMPRLLGGIVATGRREALVLGALAVCLGLALTTHALGLSLALGAFVAGLLLSESDFTHQIVAETSPLRDVFNSLFFISIGLLLEREVLRAAWPWVLAAVGLVVTIKLAAGIGAAALVGFPQRTGLLAAVALAQIGEFSFVLASDGRRAGLMQPLEHQIFLAAAILTLLLSPPLVAAAPRLAVALRRLGLPKGTARVGDAPPPSPGLADHVVLVGFGVGGRNLARVLREARVRYLVVELTGEIVRQAKAEGEPVLFGDATRPEILARAGVARASVLVVAISESAAQRQIVALARQMQRGLHIVVRTRRVAEIEALRAAGADEIVAEEFESSIELFSRVLARYHVPSHLIAAQERLLRGDRYRMLRSARGEARVTEALVEALAAGTVDLYRLSPDAAANGRTLAQLDLRQRTGATVLAVVRGGESLVAPAADLALEPGDQLVLVGSHAEIDAAFRHLSGAG